MTSVSGRQLSGIRLMAALLLRLWDRETDIPEKTIYLRRREHHRLKLITRWRAAALPIAALVSSQPDIFAIFGTSGLLVTARWSIV